MIIGMQMLKEHRKQREGKGLDLGLLVFCRFPRNTIFSGSNRDIAMTFLLNVYVCLVYIKDKD